MVPAAQRARGVVWRVDRHASESWHLTFLWEPGEEEGRFQLALE
jgi:hypothetical protein